MSIIAYTGLPGSGKSYSAVKYVIEPAIAKGREVWTNIPIVEKQFVDTYGVSPKYFETKDIIDNKQWFFKVLPPGVILVIDECWRLWPSGLKANSAIESHKSFLAEHRHLVANGFSTAIFLVTQDLSQIANFVRSLVEYTNRTTKLSMIGQDNKYRVDVYSGAVTGNSPPKSKLLKENFGVYDVKVFRLYKSHTKIDDDTTDKVVEDSIDSRYNILKGSKYKILLFVVFLLLILAGLGLQRVKKSYSNGTESVIDDPVPLLPGMTGEVVSVVPPKKLQSNSPDLLEGYELSITSHIKLAKNQQREFNIYEIKAKNNNNYFYLDSTKLVDLGYKLLPVNDCLLIVKINSSKKIISCEIESASGFNVDKVIDI